MSNEGGEMMMNIETIIKKAERVRALNEELMSTSEKIKFFPVDTGISQYNDISSALNKIRDGQIELLNALYALKKKG